MSTGNLDLARFQKICECDEDEDEEEKSHLNIQIPINKKPKMETEDTVSLPDWLEDDNQFNESDHKVVLSSNLRDRRSTPAELQIHRLHLCDRNNSPLPTCFPNQPRAYGYFLENSYLANTETSVPVFRGPYLRTRPRRGALAIQHQRRLKEETNTHFVGRVDCWAVRK